MKKISTKVGMALIVICFIYPINSGLAYKNPNKNTYVQFIRGITAYIVASPNTELQKRISEHLADYLSKVLKNQAKVVPFINNLPAGMPAIELVIKSKTVSAGLSKEAFMLDTRNVQGHSVVTVIGNTELGLKRAVQRLIIISEQSEPGLVIHDLHISESPWIPKREWALSPWDPALVRGLFYNPYVDKRFNIWLYDDQQIKNYVDMFDAFGFSGSQLLETASSFVSKGSPEAYQELLKKFATSVHNNGQDVTLWVWAAQFNGYGWVDSTVNYTPAKGYTAFTDPGVRSTFEKYYNYYAAMAPYVDMIVAHFYDPGSLKNKEDVLKYLGLLRDKFRAKNSKV